MEYFYFKTKCLIFNSWILTIKELCLINIKMQKVILIYILHLFVIEHDSFVLMIILYIFSCLNIIHGAHLEYLSILGTAVCWKEVESLIIRLNISRV